MAAAFQRTQINITDITREVNFADRPTARLMYYFSTVMNTIQIDDVTLNRFTKFENYQSLSLNEKRHLLILCYTFSPDVLMEAGLFHLVDDLPGNLGNRFYKISQAQTNLTAVGGIVIGGYRIKATRIMMFTRDWLRRNYMNPLAELAEEIEAAQRSSRNRQTRMETSQTCAIL